MIPEAAPTTQVTGRARAHCRLFVRTLRVTRDKNLAICLPFRGAYPLQMREISVCAGNICLRAFTEAENNSAIALTFEFA
jgi:hypothetical protein